MAMSLQECIDKLKKLHPDLYPVWYIEHKKIYLFNMLKRGVSKDEAVCNFYAIQPETGVVTGSIPVLSIYDNEEFSSKLDHPNIIPPEVPEVKHFQDFLMHYGIKGQKWGVRKYQNPDGSLTEEGKKRYGEAPDFIKKSREKKAQRANRIQEGQDKDLSELVNRDASKKGSIDTSASEAIAWTLINPFNSIYFAQKGINHLAGEHQTKKFMKQREKNDEIDPKTGLYLKKEGQYTEKQDLAAVNPGFINMNTNTKNNCMLCTTAYDLRKRGYDVTAQLDSEGYNFADIKKWYPKAVINKGSRYNPEGYAMSQKDYVNQAVRDIKKQGDGARGNLMIFFNYGGGHSVAYEIQNGSLIIKDGQSNKVYKNPEKLIGQSLTYSYARLDNVKPDIERIKRECVR